MCVCVFGAGSFPRQSVCLSRCQEQKCLCLSIWVKFELLAFVVGMGMENYGCMEGRHTQGASRVAFCFAWLWKKELLEVG